MKFNWKTRIKRWDFWASIAGALIAASGIAVGDMTSWHAVADAFMGIVTNPVTLVAVVVAIRGVIVDPTTKGTSDSDNVLLQNAPVQATDMAIDEAGVHLTAESEVK